MKPSKSELAILRKMVATCFDMIEQCAQGLRECSRRIAVLDNVRTPGVEPGREAKYLETLVAPDSQRRIVNKPIA